MLQNLAYIAQRQKDYERARSLFAEGLRNSQEPKDRLSVANCLLGLAGILVIKGQPHRAAGIFGTAEAVRETIGAHIQPGDRPDYEANLALLRSRLDASTFEAFWNAGRAMPLEQVVASTLQFEDS